MLKVRQHRFRYSVPKRHVDEKVVQNGLAVTPTDMEELALMGKPIQSQILGAEFYDNTHPEDFGVLPEHMRGADIVDAWEHDWKIKDKFKKALESQNAENLG